MITSIEFHLVNILIQVSVQQPTLNKMILLTYIYVHNPATIHHLMLSLFKTLVNVFPLSEHNCQ